MTLQTHMNAHGIRFFSQAEFERTNPARAWRGDNTLPREKWANAIRALLAADHIRQEWGSPVIVVSGYRSDAYNRLVGGAARSRHVEGDALDLRPVSGSLDDFGSLCARVLAWYENRGVTTGFKRYSSFVHIDIGGRARSWRG